MASHYALSVNLVFWVYVMNIACGYYRFATDGQQLKYGDSTPANAFHPQLGHYQSGTGCCQWL